MGNYNFVADLQRADYVEQEVAIYIQKNYETDGIERCSDNRYDLWINFVKDGPRKIEIKEDLLCAHTGNIAVEFEGRGRPSGIQTTISDLYIYVIRYRNYSRYLALPIKTLRRAIAEQAYFTVVTGGDKGSGTKCYLFKYEDFIQYGRFIL